MSKVEVFRYYRIELINRKTEELVYQTSYLTRKKMLELVINLSDSYDSDFFDIKVIPYNKKRPVVWIPKTDIDKKDILTIRLDENEKVKDYFTHPHP